MFLAGFANAFANNLAQDRAQNQQLTEQRQQRENAILTHLSTSDDPEIASRAVAGLMDQASGRRPLKGIRGFLNETEGNPALPAIRQLIMAGRQPQPGAPGSMAQPSGSAVTPNDQSTVNQDMAGGTATQPPPGPESIGTNVGRPGPTPDSAPIMTSAAPTPSAGGGAAPTPTTRAGAPVTPIPAATPGAAAPSLIPPAGTPGPRQVFLTKAQQTEADAAAQTRGRLAGFREARTLPEQRFLGGAAFNPQNLSGTVRTEDIIADDPDARDEQGNRIADHPGQSWAPVRLFDGTTRYRPVTPTAGGEGAIFSQAKSYQAQQQANGTPVSDEQAMAWARSNAATTGAARTSTAVSQATTAGVTAANAAPMASARLTQLRASAANTVAEAELKQRTLNGQLTREQALQIATRFYANRPGTTTDDVNEMTNALAGAPGPQAPAQTQPPPGPPAVSPAVAPAAAASTAGTPAATPPPGPPLATPSSTSAVTRPGPAARAGAEAPAPRAATTSMSAITPAASHAVTPPPAPGQLPGGISNYKPNATEQGTLDTIAGARPMMARVRQALAGYEGDNSIQSKGHALEQGVQAWAGFSPSDPVYKELAPLVSHLKVFAGSAYLHGIRNGAYVAQVQENLPSVGDTPAMVTTKLNNLDKTFSDIANAIGSTPAQAAAVGGRGAAPSAGGAGGAKTVKMVAPDGGSLTVPADQVEKYRRLGAQPVQ